MERGGADEFVLPQRARVVCGGFASPSRERRRHSVAGGVACAAERFALVPAMEISAPARLLLVTWSAPLRSVGDILINEPGHNYGVRDTRTGFEGLKEFD